MKFETYKTARGDVRWRLREANGRLVSVKPGKIMGLGHSKSKDLTSKKAVESSLWEQVTKKTSEPKRRKAGKRVAKAAND